MFLVDDEPEVLASLAAELERHFGADYCVVTDPSSRPLSNGSSLRVTAAKRLRCSWRISGCLR